jgi:GMP synthase-like glutamine amidotransferase
VSSPTWPDDDASPSGPVVLVVQHEPGAPAALVGDWLVERGLQLRVVHAYAGDPVPSAVPGDVDGVLVLGGGMGAWDDDVAPWLPATRALLAACARDDVPTWGVCLGGQLLAAATGGQVALGDLAELGVCDVTVTDADDPLMATLGPAGTTVGVTQFHRDGITAAARRAAGHVEATRTRPSGSGDGVGAVPPRGRRGGRGPVAGRGARRRGVGRAHPRAGRGRDRRGRTRARGHLAPLRPRVRRRGARRSGRHRPGAGRAVTGRSSTGLGRLVRLGFDEPARARDLLAHPALATLTAHESAVDDLAIAADPDLALAALLRVAEGPKTG